MNVRKYLRYVLVSAAVVSAAGAASAAADTWNERTVLRFSSPVLIPGTTLQPGTYVFKLARSQANRNIVQVRSEDGNELIAQTFAVPIKRQDPKGDVVLRFNPTEPGTAPALKAFFYPGSLYGHQFVYPEKQAREIANRTKTVVLSMDVDGMQSGTLRTVDASGTTRPYNPDPATRKEWDAWRASAQASVYTDATSNHEPDSRAVALQATGAKRVGVDDLEDTPGQYIGKTITVDAEVQDVFGPRLFSIDEPNWGDLEGEILVIMPTDLAAMVKENDRVSVTGTVQRYVEADLRRELTWFEPGTQLNLALRKKPVLVASKIVGGNDSMVLSIRTVQQQDTTVGTSGRNEEPDAATDRPNAGTMPEISSLGAITGFDDVGRHVKIQQVKVTALAGESGFWVKGSNPSNILVLPASGAQRRVKLGDSVSIEGVVLQMPRGRRGTLEAPGRTIQDVYVYATSLGS